MTMISSKSYIHIRRNVKDVILNSEFKAKEQASDAFECIVESMLGLMIDKFCDNV
jgi:hypothetical protein